ncbi:MAG: LysR family transcriptional regulator [Pseudomonadota bacterium]
MDNWDDLRFVLALARYGSMNQAARHLRTNTATVSRRIRRINETHGSALFIKGQNDWHMTDAGRAVYDVAARLADDLVGLESLQPQPTGEVRVVRVTSLDYLVTEVLAEGLPDFARSHPDVILELSATDANLSLAYGEADVAVRLTRPTEGRLVARRIAQLRMGVFGGDRGAEGWIGLPFDLDWTPEMKNGLAHYGRAPAARLASFHAILSAAAIWGLGAVAPEFMAAGHAALRSRQDRALMPQREVWMVLHETRKSDQILREVCRWIEQRFQGLQ